MRAVVQRVSEAHVKIDGDIVGQIGKGFLVLLGAGEDDNETDVDYLVGKVVGLRIFADAEHNMNLSLADVGGELLVVSQFTLYGDCRKGRRPSFIKALHPAQAERLYQRFVDESRKQVLRVETGRFGAMMDVMLVNDGPVTLLLDSKKLF